MTKCFRPMPSYLFPEVFPVELDVFEFFCLRKLPPHFADFFPSFLFSILPEFPLPTLDIDLPLPTMCPRLSQESFFALMVPATIEQLADIQDLFLRGILKFSHAFFLVSLSPRHASDRIVRASSTRSDSLEEAAIPPTEGKNFSNIPALSRRILCNFFVYFILIFRHRSPRCFPQFPLEPPSSLS